MATRGEKGPYFDHPVTIALRERAGRLDLNKGDLGVYVGKTTMTGSRWFNGESIPGRDDLIELEEALQFQPGELTLLAGYTPAGSPKVDRAADGTLTLVFAGSQVERTPSTIRDIPGWLKREAA